MKSEEQIKERLNGLYVRYQMVSGDTIDPELEGQIRELRWVLRS